jgi:hypothetical protein
MRSVRCTPQRVYSIAEIVREAHVDAFTLAVAVVYAVYPLSRLSGIHLRGQEREGIRLDDREQRLEVDRADRRESILFITTLVVGAGLAAVIYGVCAGNLSEKQLFLVTGLWALPMAFGLYGFVARWLQRSKPRQSPARVVARGGGATLGVLVSLLFFVILLPLKFARTQRATVTALVGMGVVAVFVVIPTLYLGL